MSADPSYFSGSGVSERPPEGAHRTSPRTLIAAGVALVGGLFFFAVQTVLQTATATVQVSSSEPSRGTPGWFLGLMGVLFVLSGASTLVTWWMRTYTVSDTELVIDEGVLTRHHRVIPFARVQQVDLEAKLSAQILGIRIVKISSAGEAGATTITLHALDRGDAEQLRGFILRRREEIHRDATARPSPAPAPTSGTSDLMAPPGPWVVDSSGQMQAPTMPPPPRATATGSASAAGSWAPPTPPPGPPIELLRLSAGRLAAATATDLRVWAIPLLVVFSIIVLAAIAALRGETAGAVVAAPVIVFLAIVFIPLITVGHVIQHYGFAVSLHGDDLHLHYGLFEVRDLTVPRRRVQQITIIDNPVRRAFGLASLRLHSAAAGAGPQTTHFDIPLVDTATLDEFLRSLMGTTTWNVPPLTPRSDRAKARAITRRVGVIVLALLVPAVLLRPNGPALLLLALAGIPWGLVAHRRVGHGRTSEVLAFSHGALDHRIDLVPIERIQSCRVVTSPFQRQAKLATLHADVAAARFSPNLFDMDDATARDLVHVLPRLSSPVA